MSGSTAKLLNQKECTKCRKTLPISKFHKDRNVSTGVRSRCKDCIAEYHVTNFDAFANRGYKHRYGITLQEKREMWLERNGSCDICGKLMSFDKNCTVDHDHLTKKIRGLLCNDCNTSIGKLGDTATNVMRAVVYLGGVV